MTAFGFMVVSWKSRHSGFSTNDPTLILYIPWCCHAKIIIIWTIKLPETTFAAISIIMHCKMTLIEGDFGKGRGGGYPIPQEKILSKIDKLLIPHGDPFLIINYPLLKVLYKYSTYIMMLVQNALYLHYVIRYDVALAIQGLLYLQCCIKTT